MKRLHALITSAMVALAMLGACGATLSGQALQPNPLAVSQPELLRESRKVRIQVHDMEVPRSYILYDTATFSVVSHDRLRFHVELVHKWEEMVDLRGWKVHLEDDAGRAFEPERRELRQRKGTNNVWDQELRTASRDIFGDVQVVGGVPQLREDGWKNRLALVSLDMFKGKGDVTFVAPDLLTRDVKRLTLVLDRGGIQLRFTWNLFDPRDSIEADDGAAGEDVDVVGQLTNRELP
jgi:hypothetical protein